MIAIPVVIVIGVLLFVKDNPAEHTVREAEGREFAKTTDQEGCMREGLSRARHINLLSIEQLGYNHDFVQECLKSSRPTSGFCEGIPTSFVADAINWQEKQCKKSGMDEVLTGCKAVFEDKVQFCNE